MPSFPLPPPEFFYGAATGLFPMTVKFLANLFMQERKRQEAQRDEFLKYLMARDVELRAENKELRHQVAELQVIVGTNQQAVKEIKQDTMVAKAAASIITTIAEGTKP